MRLSLCKFCQYASRLEDGRPVMVGIFSRMHTSGLPATLDPCVLAVEVESEPHECGRAYALELRLIDEDGRTLTTWGGDLELQPAEEPTHQRTFFTMPMPWDAGFVFPNAGAYRIDVVRLDLDGVEDVLGGETLYVSVR